MSEEITKYETQVVQGYQLGSIPVHSPAHVIDTATNVATPLAELIDKKGLFKIISGKKFVFVDGWTTMGAMLGVVPRNMPELSKCKEDGEYEETVELVRVLDGMIIGRAAAVCGGETDKIWKSRPEYARKSMAITRATGKAFRLSFSWIMTLAGFMPTPAEEMEEEQTKQPETKKPKAKIDPFYESARSLAHWFADQGKTEDYNTVLGGIGFTSAKEITDKKQRLEFLDTLEKVKEEIIKQSNQDALAKILPNNNSKRWQSRR